MMFDLADHDADRTALVQPSSGARLSYRELRRRVDQVAADLAAPTKRLVVVVGWREVSAVIGFLAALEAGHAVLWIDPALATEAFARLLVGYRPDLVIAGTAPLPAPPGDLYRECEHASLGRLWCSVDADGGPPIHPELGCLLLTSGTTGTAEVVRLRHASLQHNACAIVAALAMTEREIAITLLPISHALGLSVLTSHLAAGATVVLSDTSVLDRRFWQICRDEHVTSLAGVPFTFELLRRLDVPRVLPGAVTRLVQAGGALDLQHVRFFDDLMASRDGDFRVMYGLTEATARVTVWPRPLPPGKYQSVGQVIPGGTIRIHPATSEVLYRGPNVMMGYARHRDDLARPGETTELATGDLGSLDAEGFLFLTGRSKRIGKLAGVRINLDDVEALLGDLSVAAVERHGRLEVFVENASPGEVESAAETLSDALGVHEGFIHVESIARLPRSSAGKVVYGSLVASER